MDERENKDEIIRVLLDQKKCMKRQNTMLGVLTGMCLVCMISVGGILFTLAPKANEVLDDITASTKNLAAISTALSESDIPAMLENVNSLVKTSEDAITQAAEGMEKIDFETLNKAIEDLQTVVEPLATFAKGLSRFGQ